jgi:hypothetical protein
LIVDLKSNWRLDGTTADTPASAAGDVREGSSAARAFDVSRTAASTSTEVLMSRTFQFIG